MKILILIIFILFVSNNIYSKIDNKLSINFANMILKKWENPLDLSDKGWEYTNSIILHGIEKVYKATLDKKYLEYIRRWVDYYIDENGNISFKNEMYNLDFIHPGLLLLFLYEETGLEKYKKAAFNLKKRLDTHPRNTKGGFFHKDIYVNEMWLDGIYMAQPFLVKFGYLFNQKEACNNEATFQAILIAEHTQDKTTGLLYHAWDEDKNAFWANKETGRSGFVWLRAMGWYLMALVDILDYLPKDHKDYNKIIDILKNALSGLKKYQDKKTGLWYQVVDKPDEKHNWIETSGSCMIIYVIKKSLKNQYINNEYQDVLEKAWKGIKKFISVNENNEIEIRDAVEGMGVQSSYNAYITKRRLVNSPHGLCGILLASSAMEY